MKTNVLFGLLLITVFSACAHPETVEACVDATESSGFWAGVLHGFFAPLAFLVSLLVEDLAMYDLNNNGNWYNLGFLLGIGGFSSGVFKSSRKK